ncbi:phage tail protein [Salmonella enterica]|nr:phage tail protein [Salmonella enterica]EIJ0056076.1 phage tail protein [Salmonella enterica]EKC9096693.1 phage tail protein [Salmonella enterica]
MSQAVITKVFSEWKAQQAINNQPVTLDEFIFAYIPGLDTDKPIDNTETIPAADKIVDRLPVSKTGVVNENSVVYSVTLGADVGDYDFNWIGLANKATGTLAMIIHAPTQRKIKNANGQQGNVLVRSMLMEYSGARETTEITTPAETWQIDFTARLSAMDERQRRENIDLYGAAAFFDSGYLVAKTSNQFFVTKGAGYVAGLRAELPADLNIKASAKPTKVWLDVSWAGTLTSEWAVQSKITVAADLADYVLGGVQHYVFAVASIDAAGNITDLRPKGTLNDQAASDALKKHEQSRNHPDATTSAKGFTQLSSATDSTSEELAATSKAVKIAMDNANARLAKDRNGSDIPNPALFVQNIGLQGTVNKADGAIQRSGDNMEGPLGLTRTSSFGVGTENSLGGNSIAIGDNDSGFKSNGDGNIALMANNVLAGYFSENELQHREKILTKVFKALVENNWSPGAGGLGAQLNSGAPFMLPSIQRPNNDNNYFPFWKQIVSLLAGYPVAASMGIMTSGQTNFPQIVIHAKTDFDVNDKLWIFDVASGEFRSPGRLLGTEIFLSGKTRIAADGNINSDVWGGWLTDYLNNTYNKKNTASLGDTGWYRDESTGFIEQWGTLGSSNGTYNFPRAFPNKCFAVFVTNNNEQGGVVDNAYGYPVSTTQFFAATKDSTSEHTISGYPVAWRAIGR